MRSDKNIYLQTESDNVANVDGKCVTKPSSIYFPYLQRSDSAPVHIFQAVKEYAMQEGP
jgi:hypothetical protein